MLVSKIGYDTKTSTSNIRNFGSTLKINNQKRTRFQILYYLLANGWGYSVNFPMIILNYVPEVLEMSSILHVTLLVFLRLIAILKPLSYKAIHVQLRFVSITTIWVISCLCHGIIRIIYVLVPKQRQNSFYDNASLVILHCFITVPVISLFIMYVLLILVIRKKNQELKEHTLVTPNVPGKANRNILVKRVVMVFVTCYVPFLVWRHYFFNVFSETEDAKLSNVEVI